MLPHSTCSRAAVSTSWHNRQRVEGGPTIPTKSLVGEQSNAYRILLRYDRKSRHRRIKKRRRYERLAATSQFLSTHGVDGGCPLEPPSPLRRFGADAARSSSAPSRVGVARTLSGAPARPPGRGSTNTLASVEPPNPWRPPSWRVSMARSAADRLYLADC